MFVMYLLQPLLHSYSSLKVEKYLSRSAIAITRQKLNVCGKQAVVIHCFLDTLKTIKKVKV